MGDIPLSDKYIYYYQSKLKTTTTQTKSATVEGLRPFLPDK